MADYYKILGVKPSATPREIKSAYRTLARKRHPDVNGGSENAAREFALLAIAYRTLSDPQERAFYDAKRAKGGNGFNGGRSVINSDNPHARRMRRVVLAQARWDSAVDSWLERERRDTSERMRAVFTTVSLFLSTFIVAVLKPRFWQSFDDFGRAILLTLFAIGVWHLATRLREYFEHYTYKPNSIHVSLMGDEEKPDKPFTRFTAYAFLIIGYAASLGAGLFVGVHTHYIVSDLAYFFDQHVRPDLLFYPPIAVLIVDTMHSVASKIDA